jgi:hypothetical protein
MQYLDQRSVGIARQKMIRESTDPTWVAQQLPIDWFATGFRLAAVAFSALLWVGIIAIVASI